MEDQLHEGQGRTLGGCGGGWGGGVDGRPREREPAENHFQEGKTETPNVGRHAVTHALDALRAHVSVRTHETLIGKFN